MRLIAILVILVLAVVYTNAQTIANQVSTTPSLSSLNTQLGNVLSLQTLLGAAGNYTLFAPDNVAFTNLPADNSTGLYGSLNQTLYYHVINGLIPANAALDTAYDTLVSGTKVRINHYTATGLSGFTTANGQRITSTVSPSATNGQVQIITDHVLYLPLGTPAIAAAKISNFSIAVSLVQKAGIDLNTLNPSTIFIPTDPAFIAFNATLQTVGNNLNLLTNAQLITLFNNHIIGANTAAYFSKAFVNPSTITFNTQNGNASFAVNVTTASTITVFASGSATGGVVVLPDIVTTTGVIHGVNAVLYPAGFVVPPPSPTPSPTSGPTTGATTGASSTTGSSASSIAASLILLIFSVFIACF